MGRGGLLGGVSKWEKKEQWIKEEEDNKIIWNGENRYRWRVEEIKEQEHKNKENGFLCPS